MLVGDPVRCSFHELTPSNFLKVASSALIRKTAGIRGGSRADEEGLAARTALLTGYDDQRLPMWHSGFIQHIPFTTSSFQIISAIWWRCGIYRRLVWGAY